MKIKISIEWWDDSPNKRLRNKIAEIPENHKAELEQHAISHIAEERKEFNICGELLITIDGINYRGWWEVKGQ